MGELFQQAEAWLDRIEQIQDYTLPYVDAESKTEPVRLNLMMSFWFYDGDQLTVREYFFNKILEYIKLTGIEFQKEASVNGQQERKFRKDGFPENWYEDIKKKKSNLIYYFSNILLIDRKRNYFTTTLRVEPSLMRMMLRPF